MPSEQELDFAKQISSLETMVDSHEKTIVVMAGDIKDIKDNLLKRPSWSVSIIISLLLAACVGLLVHSF